VKAPKDLANFLIVEINGYLNKEVKTIAELPLKPATSPRSSPCKKRVVYPISNAPISLQKSSRILFDPLKRPRKNSISSPRFPIRARSWASSMRFEANPQSIVDYKAGKDRALGFLVGQVMKASHGKVNPAEVSRLLKEELDKR
jgi:aspartyl-tRNA(Asn)/glutamyl-tRNA(Gln) amidotransferase subunit B